MPIWNLSAEVSDILDAQVEEWRGKVPIEQFLLYALEIGLGHIEEEHVIKKRERVYEDMRHTTDHFRDSVDRQKMKVVAAPQKAPANVAAFGNDMTRRNAS